MNVFATAGSWLLDNAGIAMSAISGVFALFRERWNNRVWKALPIVGIVGGMLWALAAAEHDAREHRKNMEEVIGRVNDWVSQQTKTVTADVDLLRSQLERQGVLQAKAQTADVTQVREILKAEDSAQRLVGEQSAQRRSALSIYVFHHFTKDVNFDVVKPRLQELGATVTVLPPLADSPTNSVWWGPGSSLEEAKAAALIAMSAGVQIRQICASNKPHPGVSDLIQIGGAAAAQKMPVMSAEEVRNLSAPRCD